MEDIFSITSSRRILKSEWKTEGSIPFIRVRDMVQLANKEPLTNEFFVSEAFYASRPEEEKVVPGDIIVSATSTIGKTYIIKPGERFYFKDADVLLFRKKKPINEVFFTYGLTMPTMWDQISGGLGATTVAHFLISKACKLIQPLPPMELQERFATISQQSDKSKFTGFKSQFIEMFGQLPEHFKHDTVELGKIADMLSGGTPSSKNPEYYGDKYPFVTTPCLGKNYIDESDAVNWLSEAGVRNSSTHIIPAYSVMYGNRVGVGKSSINTCEMCTNQDILSFFNIDTSNYDLLFIKKVMDQYFDYVDTQKRGSTIKGVPSDIVKSIRIPKVPIGDQRAFAEFTQQSDKSK